jgi:hypothetical protein
MPSRAWRWMSMKPGEITWSPASITRAADSVIDSAIRTIVSPRMAISLRYQGLPLLSTIRPLRRIWRKAVPELSGSLRDTSGNTKTQRHKGTVPLCLCVFVFSNPSSKHNLRGELDLPLRARLRLECRARDRRERTACRTLVRQPEIRVIGQIKEFRPELE